MGTGLHVFYFVALFLLLFCSLLSAFFVRSIKGAKYFSIPINIVAAIFGIIFGLSKLISSDIPMQYKTNIGTGIVNFSFYIDRLSAFFIFLISLVFLTILIYSIGYLKHYSNKNLGQFFMWLSLFALSMILVVSAGQLFFFLFVWELMALSSYFLVIFDNEKKEAQNAGKLYFIMTHAGTALIILAFGLIYMYSGTAYLGSIDVSQMSWGMKSLVFLMMFAGFATKGGLVPFHIWLPEAHPAAPSNVSAFMSGIMLKMAVFGFIRFAMETLGTGLLWWGILVVALGSISAILGVMYALMENDIKRLLAYSSIENLGIIFVGLGMSMVARSVGSPILASFCLIAALFHALNHSFFKSLLFMGAGSIQYACGTKNMEKLGGLIRKMPYTSLLFFIGALSICAIPPFNGFASEWMIYQGLFAGILSGTQGIGIFCIIIIAILAMAGVLAAYALVKVYSVTYLAVPRSDRARNAKEVPKTMILAMTVLGILCFASGIFPSVFTKLLGFACSDMDGFKSGNIDNWKIIFQIEGIHNSITPSLLAICAVIFGILALLFGWIFFGKSKTRIYGTWDCGFKRLTPRMQYTATGFSKPIRIIFKWLFRPERELVIQEQIGKYHIKKARYNVKTVSVFEVFLYRPFVMGLLNFSRRFRFTVQMGSVHVYLLYIFAALVCMFVYFAMSNGV